MLIVGIYAAIRASFALLVKFPVCHAASDVSEKWPFFQFFKWIYQVFDGYRGFIKSIENSKMVSVCDFYLFALVPRNGIMLDMGSMKEQVII